MSALLGAVGARHHPPGKHARGMKGRRGRRRRRGRGISAAGIRAARKLLHLLQDFAMAVPHTRGRVRGRPRRRYFSRKRRGDPDERYWVEETEDEDDEDD